VGGAARLWAVHVVCGGGRRSWVGAWCEWAVGRRSWVAWAVLSCGRRLWCLRVTGGGGGVVVRPGRRIPCRVLAS
jgi:hypothetical protein